MTTEEQTSPWDTETGLPNDVDGWIANPKFGTKDEYAQAVVATGAEGGLMFLIDLVDEKGELIGSQGYSIGTGWEISEDGLSISHPKRKNVVSATIYGILQNRVVKELGLQDMMVARGKPTEAKSWDGLGFHWMQQPHKTVGGQEATSLMPIHFLSERAAAGAPAATAAIAPAAPVEGIERTLAALARTLDVKAFQEKALGLPSVATNDELMAKVLDEGAEGFWATHQA